MTLALANYYSLWLPASKFRTVGSADLSFVSCLLAGLHWVGLFANTTDDACHNFCFYVNEELASSVG